MVPHSQLASFQSSFGCALTAASTWAWLRSIFSRANFLGLTGRFGTLKFKRLPLCNVCYRQGITDGTTNGQNETNVNIWERDEVFCLRIP